MKASTGTSVQQNPTLRRMERRASISIGAAITAMLVTAVLSVLGDTFAYHAFILGAITVASGGEAYNELECPLVHQHLKADPPSQCMLALRRIAGLLHLASAVAALVTAYLISQ
jgi:hypothetical protein